MMAGSSSSSGTGSTTSTGMATSSIGRSATAPFLSQAKFTLPAAAAICAFAFLSGSIFGGTLLPPLQLTTPSNLGHHHGSEQQQQQGLRRSSSAASTNRRQLVASEELSSMMTKQLTSLEANANKNAWVPVVGGSPSLMKQQRNGTLPPPIIFQVLSWQPRAFYFPYFMDHKKCDAIVSLAKRSLEPSGLALKPGESEEESKDVRTSSGTFLTAADDLSGSLAWVEQRMAEIVAIPPENGEAFNVLRYEIGQKYDAHADYFDPKDYGPQKTQRVATFLLYLTDVEEGGETMFPYEGNRNKNGEFDFNKCMGLVVKPRKGAAILFWSVHPGGTLDELSVHASCPVIRGEKWVATKWIRDSVESS